MFPEAPEYGGSMLIYDNLAHPVRNVILRDDLKLQDAVGEHVDVAGTSLVGHDCQTWCPHCNHIFRVTLTVRGYSRHTWPAAG